MSLNELTPYNNKLFVLNIIPNQNINKNIFLFLKQVFFKYVYDPTNINGKNIDRRVDIFKYRINNK